jgi:hypothetical protein
MVDPESARLTLASPGQTLIGEPPETAHLQMDEVLMNPVH